ncbi:phage protein Gp27 family protein [Litorisediminicola beolgyonensis]|uniref:Phage protein Gp27 family protein n=1 Tax=Litorisediminicola beolgyonensis TaxID=1173614 RepID=A0ABW3ZJH3_9RHOB
MPPPRKVDLLPEELRRFLQEELKARGFGDYEQLAEDLNFRLQEEGLELRIGKSALHAYGQEYQEFVRVQEEASAWAADWMNQNGLEEEAQRHNVLFQMITSLAWKVMHAQMTKPGDEIDPKELHFIGRMLKDVMASSGIREKLVSDERERAAREARQAAADSVEKNARQLGLTGETVAGIKAQILGVSG